ncbi:hypothetical protein F4777DRAFT_453618 [Nemania sp. FL0916]|nr:hypothetical protein F4777DRAFT_453618 [Nemania sp. FL0916]
MSELIKAFAIRLGTCSPKGIGWRIMHFVYKHHNEICSALKDKLGDEDAYESKNTTNDKGSMSLADKMSLWTKDRQEFQVDDTDQADQFEGVDDFEGDEPLSTPELSVYSKVILDSPAYKWLLEEIKNSLSLEWGDTVNAMDKIRETILRKLRPGKICRSQPPKTFTVTFLFRDEFLSSLKAGFGAAHGQQNVSPLSNHYILTASGYAELQVSAIGYYVERIWPEFETKLLDGLQWFLGNFDGSYSTNFIYGGSMMLSYDQSTLRAEIHGPAYIIARCAEQLAWLETALRPPSVSPIFYTPFLSEIGELQFLVHAYQTNSTCPSVLEGFVPQKNVYDQALYLTSVNGYPTSRRPKGFSGVEMPSGFPGPGAKLRFHAQSRQLILHAGSFEFLFVKRKADVWFWHTANSMHASHIYHDLKTLESIVDVFNQGTIDMAVFRQRHIIGNHVINDDQKELSSDDDHLPLRTMTRTDISQPVDNNEFRTENKTFSNSLDSDLLSFSSFSEVTEGSTMQLKSGFVNIVNNTAARLLEEFNTRVIPLKSAAQNDGVAPKQSRTASGDSSYAHKTAGGHINLRPWLKQKSNQRNEDEEDDDVPENRPSKKRKYEPDPQQKLFACPYWKLNPIKYRFCFQLKLLTSSRVKQHLSRNHTPRFYCQVCYLLFADKQAQEAHVIQRSCNRQSGTRLDGILPEQQLELSRKPKSALSEKQKWFKIWEIVFPDEQLPLSPYIDSKLADCCARFREHLQNRGTDILASEIRNSGLLSMDAVDEDERQQILRRVLARGLDTIFRSMPTPTHSENSAPVLSQHLSTVRPMESPATPTSLVDDALKKREGASLSAVQTPQETPWWATNEWSNFHGDMNNIPGVVDPSLTTNSLVHESWEGSWDESILQHSNLGFERN